MDANKTGPKRPKKPRLTALNRLDIEVCLNDGKLPYAIAKRIGCSVRTVVREILARAKSVNVGVACRLSNKCVLTKRFYRGAAAQENHETILSESRRGVNLTEEEIGKFDELMYGLVKKGQSIHAIMVNNPTLFTFCEKSAYRYVNGNLLLTKRHNLPRACSIKPRKGDKPVEAKADKLCRVGREYSRYLAKLAANPGMNVTEMDTVEGKRGGKCLLTLIFNPTYSPGSDPRSPQQRRRGKADDP